MTPINEILDVLIRETATILSIEPSGISPDAPLPSLGFDSLRFVELLVAIEANFDVNLIEMGIQPEDVRTLRTVAECIDRGS